MSRPAINFMSHFVQYDSVNEKSGEVESFDDYVDYMNREEARKENPLENYDGYTDYMGNPNKNGSLFTKEKNGLTKKEIKKVKKIYKEAQDKKSNLWQDVFSFDNEWLEKQGLYDSKTKVLDEEKIQIAVRNAMGTLEKKSGKKYFWSSSIHYNTGNIHIHIGSVQLDKIDRRGKRKLSAINAMKSSFANSLVDFNKEYQKINEVIREKLVYNARNYDFKNDKEMKNDIKKIMMLLPKDKKQWHYKYNTLHEVRPLIDRVTDKFIEGNLKEEFKELNKLLDEHEERLRNLYGEGKNEYYKNYKETKIKEFYTRMGNATLKQIKELYTNKNYREKNFSKGNSSKEKNTNKNDESFEYKNMKENFNDKEFSNLYKYSEKNRELIKNKFPKATVVASKSFWKKQGLKIKEGENGIEIFIPEKQFYFINKDGFKTNINEATEKEKKLIETGKIQITEGKVKFIIGEVYDISQTNATEKDLKKIKDGLKNIKFDGNIKYKEENKFKKRQPIITQKALNTLKKNLKKDFNSIKNQIEFEKLQGEIENSNSKNNVYEYEM
ncbi:relaxase MobL [Clostridium sardiniense]|uniref:Relaxase MobL n=1 Tax=Clostridium sardiniense TaxID=29369 RepID=A0ABS7L0L5_CLOSR|nr:MobP2 family relaxase [Clostridium sardiniense]MBY0756287.1 relaxase MobL [Clostridium sardiniense]MDQ0458498.1 hypothetical protein [Clostridium sardiniense]